jgi:hypothetical protein
MRVAFDLKVAFPSISKYIPEPTSIHAKNGLRYERKVVKALSKAYLLSHNPWYFFEDMNGPGHIVPDAIIEYQDQLIIIEIKLTYTAEAIFKLRNLYCPVISYATNKETLPLVITKNLTSASPNPAFNVSSALINPEPLLHWLGKGNLD